MVNSKQAGLAFFDQAMALLENLRRTQADNIQKAADLCAERIACGGLVFLFGNGHSRMMCEEMTPRQGCYAGFVALVELALSNHASIIGTNGLRAPLYLENYEGYAEQILRSFHFGANDSFISGSAEARAAGDRDRLQSALRTGQARTFFGKETDRLRRFDHRQPVPAG
jgi:uncharacterized phosphosugar-binding protein